MRFIVFYKSLVTGGIELSHETVATIAYLFDGADDRDVAESFALENHGPGDFVKVGDKYIVRVR